MDNQKSCSNTGNDSCSLSRNGLFRHFERQVARMVFLRFTVILAICFSTAAEKDTRESIERFNWVKSTNRCDTRKDRKNNSRNVGYVTKFAS